MNLKPIFVSLVACATVLSFAQVDSAKPIGVGARIGAFFPSNNSAQTVGNTWLDLGIDFQVKKLSPTASLAASLDYAYRSNYRSLPLLLNYVVRKGSAYALAGVGVNFNRIPQNDGTVYDKTKFAYDLGIGYDLSTKGGTPIFVEGRFFGDDNSNLNGFGVFIGVRL